MDGPNLFHAKRVLVMTIDLEDLAEVDSTVPKNFISKLTDLLPGLVEHRCSVGARGGFIERLNRGTYPAHIIEHIALELSTLTGIEVGYGKTIYGGAPGIYTVVVRSLCDAGMSFLLRTATDIVDALMHNQSYELASQIEEARKIIFRNQLGPSTQAIVSAAEKRNIPWKRLNEYNMIQFGYGKYRKLIQASTTSETSDVAVDIAQDKELTKKFLEQARLPVPRGTVVYTEEEAVEAFNDFGTAIVIKPLDANHGKGVTLQIETEKQVREAFLIAHEYSSGVIVEELIYGEDYRILIVGGKTVAAARRLPAHVVGDGQLTISQLIEQENLHPHRGEGHEKPLTQISAARAETFLSRKEISMSQIPINGQVIFLCDTANLSTGGTAVDVTDQVHPETRAICERAARIVGLDICGVDLITQDISRPLRAGGRRGGIVEVNAGPGLRMHAYPSSGQARDVGGAIMDHLFPQHMPCRIPIISITGTNGKTTVSKLVRHILKQNGYFVGCTTSTGIYIGDERVEIGDTTGPASASVVLSDPGVEVAVLETARGGITRRGLGYSWSDVGVLTNIQPDHIGQDGIRDLDDLLHIKGLVAERVRPGGTVVLNADDPLLQQLASSPIVTGSPDQPKRLVYFSMDEQNPVLQTHFMNGGTGYFFRSGMLIETKGNHEFPLVQVNEVPITLGGTATFQIANVMAAIAAARSIGMAIAQIRPALHSFSPVGNNPGRGNVYQLKKGFIVLDYGHNPDGIQATGQMISQWNVSTATAIIGAPGDRDRATIQKIGEISATFFNKVIAREDEDLRGRSAGEVAQIVCQAVTATDPSVHTSAILDSTEALSRAIQDMVDGEVIVYYYDDLEKAENELAQIGAVPVHGFTLFTQNSSASLEVG